MTTTTRCIPLFLALAFTLPATHATEPAAGGPIDVDVAVRLKSAKVVFNMDHRAFQGDLPVGIKYMAALTDRLKEQRAAAQIVAVFHGEAGYMVLDDAAYNAARKVDTGNPYKALLGGLIAKGVQVEMCVVTMKSNGWGRGDLLPGVKVNSGAIMRLIQLHQEGYVEIHP